MSASVRWKAWCRHVPDCDVSCRAVSAAMRQCAFHWHALATSIAVDGAKPYMVNSCRKGHSRMQKRSAQENQQAKSGKGRVAGPLIMNVSVCHSRCSMGTVLRALTWSVFKMQNVFIWQRKSCAVSHSQRIQYFPHDRIIFRRVHKC